LARKVESVDLPRPVDEQKYINSRNLANDRKNSDTVQNGSIQTVIIHSAEFDFGLRAFGLILRLYIPRIVCFMSTFMVFSLSRYSPH